MSITTALLVPGSPLPWLRKDNPPWREISAGFEKAARVLSGARPDAILFYSTQWIAVLDELWQIRRSVSGVHVDENWYEYGDLSFDLTVDTELAQACIEGCRDIGVSAKGVDYEGFPVDSGTIVANNYLNPGGRIPVVLAANNLYHDWDLTWRLAGMAAAKAESQGKKIAVVGVGGLSGTIFREEIDISRDHIASDSDDAWNRRFLGLLEKGESAKLEELRPEYIEAARVEMGLKHLSWILGAVGGRFYGARIHAYGPVYGAGAAVVELRV